MAKLKPWYQVVTPREDLRENRALDASEFAVNLGHIHDRRAEVHKDYLEPDRFFSRTLLTQGLRDLATQVLRRMNGMTLETSAVFNMATQFGGGKTHSLTALYHIATGGQPAAKWKGIETLMSAAGVSSIPQAAVAVFNGKDFDSLTGRGGGNEPVRKTPWGDIAWQLGKADALSVIAEHDREFIEPKGDAIRAFLPKDRPVVILMDELISYVSTYRGRGYGDRLYNFIDCLAEVARGEKNVVVVVSVPASELEYTAADTADEARFKKMLDRVGKAILMSADKEMPEIIRRRLFEWEGLPEEGRKTAIAYADWAVEHSSELAGINRDTALEAFKSCYPFHPSVIALFEGKWQSVRQFQRTRGILKLLALWVSNNCQPANWKHTAEPLITLGLAPFDNQLFRAALFEQLGDDKLEIPVTTDIWKKDGETHSARLDKEATDAIKTAQLHRKVAATIFFESSGGMSADHAEASLSEIKTDVCGPDVNTADVDTVLEGLAGTCFYLQWERNRYRFGLSPNLNQVLVNRRGGVQPKPIEERIRQQTETLFRKSSTDNCKFIEREFFPKRSNDVKEVPRITLVAMSLEYPAQERDTLDLMEAIVRDCGSKGRTFKSALVFAVSDPAENIHDKAREVLAWEDIDDDEETKKRIDEGQLNLLNRNLKNAQRDLDEAIFRAYKHLYLLGKDNKLRHIDLGNITSSAAGCLVEVYLLRLGSGGLDEIVDSVPARKLPNFWPASQTEWSTKAVRDAFYSSPLLPRLLNPEMIKRTIADGVTQGIVGYAIKDASGRLKLEKLKDSLFDADVEISDDVYILKADEAQKQREPPRVIQVLMRPAHETVKTGNQIAFSCSGIDQYGQIIAVSEVQWSATGGTIDANGIFSAGDHGGAFTVTALTAGVEAPLAEVRITAHDEPTPTLPSDPVAPSDRFIRWRGNVPSQKWMNFYTKILSKFANAQGLKIEVSFEVKVDQEHSDAKAAETRSGLKELGLGDQVDVV